MIITSYYVISAMSSLRIENLSKTFGQHNAILNASWEAEHGEIICLLGHSGCGKTTMLRLLAGLETPNHGCIRFENRILWSSQHNIATESRNIGLVFQDYALFPHLNVFDNVKFGLTHLNKLEQQHATKAVLQHVALSQHAEKYPHTLSGGEQQRVALARALVTKPDILLMDEPFSNLDRQLRDRIRQDTINILRKSGTTTIIVTHDPEEALQISDRIILMHEGKIIQIGTPKQLYDTPNCLFAAEYFSTINKIPCTLKNNTLHSTYGQFEFNHQNKLSLTEKAPQEEYIYCFRPYHVALSETPQHTQSIAATVISSHYLGHQQSVHLQINNSTHNIHAQGIFHCPTHEGQQLFIHIQPQQGFVFSEDSIH